MFEKILFLLILYFIGGYIINILLVRMICVDEAYSTLSFSIRKLYSVIADLTEYAGRHLKFESNVIKEINEALMVAEVKHITPDEEISVNIELTHLIIRFTSSLIYFPEFNADPQFKSISSNIKKVDDEIYLLRDGYNKAVTDYNSAVETFPTNIIAFFLNYSIRKIFIETAAERKKRETEEKETS
jgi:LemA protein